MQSSWFSSFYTWKICAAYISRSGARFLNGRLWARLLAGYDPGHEASAHDTSRVGYIKPLQEAYSCKLHGLKHLSVHLTGIYPAYIPAR